MYCELIKSIGIKRNKLFIIYYNVQLSLYSLLYIVTEKSTYYIEYYYY